jgi:hypothetical protein
LAGLLNTTTYNIKLEVIKPTKIQLFVSSNFSKNFTGYVVTLYENPIYVFLEKELHGLSPKSYIHVSVSDLYIPRIGPHIWLQQNRQTDPGNI